MKEPKAMREIHSIQEKIYEETKNMKTNELLRYYNSASEEIEKKYGIKLRKAKDRILV